MPPRLLILPFLGDSSEIAGWVPSFGEDLATIAGTEFEATARCKIVTIPATGAAMDVDTAPTGILKPDLVLVGTVSRFGNPSPNGILAGPRTTTQEQGRKAEVAIVWQVIDPASSSSLKSGYARAEESGRAFSLKDGYIPKITLSKTSHEFTNSALGKATLAAIANLVSNACLLLGPPPTETAAQKKPTWRRADQSEEKPSASKISSATAVGSPASDRDIQGKILGGTKQNILIDIGRNKGVLVGDEYRVFEPAVNSSNSAQPSRPSGVIQIREVQSDLSIGAYVGSSEPQPGWLVRLR